MTQVSRLGDWEKAADAINRNHGEKLGLEGKNDECFFSQIEFEMMTNNLGGGTK